MALLYNLIKTSFLIFDYFYFCIIIHRMFTQHQCLTEKYFKSVPGLPKAEYRLGNWKVRQIPSSALNLFSVDFLCKH